MPNFIEQLGSAVERLASPVVVGLDPRWEQLPGEFHGRGGHSLETQAASYAAFCNAVSDVVSPLVPAVKVQAAFFEELGPAGMAAMADVIAHAQQQGLLVVVDGKRNDIGNTAMAYARGYLGRGSGQTGNAGISAWGADALTVSPYLGDDSLKPFVDVAKERGAGVFVLVKTSNPGGKMLQDLLCEGGPLYQHVAEYVEKLADATAGGSGYGLVGAVVGATYPQQLAELRATMRHTWFLVPGYGAQGGSASDVAAAFDARGRGAIVNNSRGIIFAHERPEYARFSESQWQQAVEAAARDMIDELRAVLPGSSQN